MSPARNVLPDPAEPPDSETGGTLLPVGVVARWLEVSTATLRAWERRYGMGPGARTMGGHRRYSLDDLERLRRMRDLLRLGVAAAEAARAAGAPRAPAFRTGRPSRLTVDRLTRAMHRLDADAISALAAGSLHAMGAADAWTQVFAPALVAIGEHWATTGCGVEVEHLTSGILEAALRRHLDAQAARVEQHSGPIVLAAAPGEHHTLPLTALAAALADARIPSVLFGDLPGSALKGAIGGLGPAAVVLWARAHDVADVGWLGSAADTSPGGVYSAGPGWPPVDGAEQLPDLPAALRTLVPLGHRPAPVGLLDSQDVWPLPD